MLVAIARGYPDWVRLCKLNCYIYNVLQFNCKSTIVTVMENEELTTQQSQTTIDNSRDTNESENNCTNSQTEGTFWEKVEFVAEEVLEVVAVGLGYNLFK
jgi:hypothetical protein